MGCPLTNDSITAGPVPRHESARTRPGRTGPGRGATRPSSPTQSPPSDATRPRPGGLAPTTPLPRARADPSFSPFGAHKTPRVVPRIRVFSHLAPTNRLGWRHKSRFLAVWRPQIPSAGDANASARPPGAHKTPRVAERIVVSRRLAPTSPLRRGRECQCAAAWRPQTPSDGGTNRSFASFGTHKSPPVGTRMPVRGHLAPTKPLGWRQESEFRVVWRPQIPSHGGKNRSFASSGAHTRSPPPGTKMWESGGLAPTRRFRRGNGLGRFEPGDPYAVREGRCDRALPAA